MRDVYKRQDLEPDSVRRLCDAYDEEVVGQDKNGKDDVRVCLLYTSRCV